MQKNKWKKPMILSLSAKEVHQAIKAAAWSGACFNTPLR
jgi:hypothetical protein